jgi:hypothetical protein
MRTAIITAFVILTTVFAEAQEQPQKPTARTLRNTGQLGVGIEPKLYSKSSLLSIPKIQDVLILTEAQKVDIKNAEAKRQQSLDQFQKERSKVKANLKAQGDQDSEIAYDRMLVENSRRLTRTDEQAVMRVLTKDQLKRLEQIQIRASGYLAFSIPEVQEKLGLLPEQSNEIATLISQGRQVVFRAAAIPVTKDTDFSLMSDEQKDKNFSSQEFQQAAAKTRANVQIARDSVLRNIVKVLDNSQRGAYKVMIGKDFDFGTLSPDFNKKKSDDHAKDDTVIKSPSQNEKK